MTTYDCCTQEELTKVLTKATTADLVNCLGNGYFEVGDQATVSAWDQAIVSAWDQATVRAGDQATVSAGDQATVRAGDQATVRVWGQATVSAWGQATVSACDQATVRAGDQVTVSAWGQAIVRARDQATVSAGEFNTVSVQGSLVSLTGGILIPNPATPAEWCVLQGANIESDTAILFKAVGKDFKSAHGMSYAPGSSPEAPDWDGGQAECGGGLHFVAHPWEGLQFNRRACRFVACRVPLAEIVVHQDAQYPNKVKAPRVLECWEVDIDGKRIEQPEVTA